MFDIFISNINIKHTSVYFTKRNEKLEAKPLKNELL